MDQNYKGYNKNRNTESSRSSDNSKSLASNEESQGKHSRDRNSRPDVIQQAIPIPFYKVGWVVGRKGSYIAQLCMKSGATVTISDTESREFGTTWKYVMMYGTGREIDKAKKLLHIRLERYIPKTPLEMEAARSIIDSNHDQTGEEGDPNVDPSPKLDNQEQQKDKELLH